MENTHPSGEVTYLDKTISPDDYKQIDVISKLFKCTFDETLSAVLQTDGTFKSISKLLKE